MQQRSFSRSILTPRNLWFFFAVCLALTVFSALMAQQDVDMVALTGESVPFLSLFVKWLVVAFLWSVMLAPCLILQRLLKFKRYIAYAVCQLALAPLIGYTHLGLWYFIFSSLAKRPPFALRHPHAYYIASRLASDSLFYLFLVGCIHSYLWYRRMRAERFQRLRAERDLLHAQLQALNLQLQPHFLFNALNSVSSLMRKDVDAADDLLVELGQYLRRILAISPRPTITLEDELALARSYFELENSRHTRGATLDLKIAQTALGIAVPPMILQPLIENAFVHSKTPNLTIGVTVRLAQEMVSVRVENNGALLSNSDHSIPPRIGIRNVQERLRALYGSSVEFSLRNRYPDGVCVEIVWPQNHYGEAADA